MSVHTSQPEHRPIGDPCKKCGQPFMQHRQREHASEGDPCRRCLLPVARHTEDRERPGRATSRNADPIVFVDGEGQTLYVDETGRATPFNASSPRKKHLYTYLAAVDETGRTIATVSDYERGLSTAQCLDFLLSLPGRAFGFSVGYDLAKMLRDLPKEKLYLLVRPEKRPGRDGKGQAPVFWGPYKLGYVRGRFTVSRKLRGSTDKPPSTVLWDVWRFYSCAFTDALTDWQIATRQELEGMQAMKNERAIFDTKDRKEIERYCLDECAKGAKLVRALITAHEDAEVPLKAFYGAGSTASALLQKLRVKQYMTKAPHEMAGPLARAFFGGRFETSQRGPILTKCWNADLSGAYVLELYRQPCLACGTWRHVKGKREIARALADAGAQIVLVHAHVARSSGNLKGWGVLPWRAGRGAGKMSGTIVFPRTNPGVWVYRDEYLAAERLSSGVHASEAWVYRTGCVHRPFAELPALYRQRLRIGKEGKGLVLKLGLNSLYGKTAQSVGQRPYQSWVWAGSITSGTRAKLLDALGSASDPWSILMLATDGIFGHGDAPKLPAPLETGTGEVMTDAGKLVNKPLGGWEVKDLAGGMMLIRPGIYFPLGDVDERGVKARGVSKRVLMKSRDAILEHWAKHQGREKFEVRGLSRFVGLVTGFQERGKRGVVQDPRFGEWAEHVIELSYGATPKRTSATPAGRLLPWNEPPLPRESAPYENAVVSPDAQVIKISEAIAGEQPGGDWIEGITE